MSQSDCSGPRVAPAQQEGLQAAADRVLDEAAARAQVEEVVAADRRRHDQHRPLVGPVSVVGVYWISSAYVVLVDRPDPGSAPGPRRPSAHRAWPSRASRRCGAGRARSCPSPRPGWRPRSRTRFSAAGLPGRMFVGAAALVRIPTTKRARSAWSRCPGVMSSTTLSTAVPPPGTPGPAACRPGCRPCRVLEPPVASSRRDLGAAQGDPRELRAEPNACLPHRAALQQRGSDPVSDAGRRGDARRVSRRDGVRRSLGEIVVLGHPRSF